MFDAAGLDLPVVRPKVWVRSPTSGPDRLEIAATAEPVRLLRTLASSMQDDYWLLYILTVSRTDQPVGRYQVPEPIGKQALLLFLETFHQYLESDARHHLWIGSTANNNLLVYDKHEVIYAYGDLDRFQSVLNCAGFVEADSIETPMPHTHNYHQEFDCEEIRILKYFEWKRLDLQPSDD